MEEVFHWFVCGEREELESSQVRESLGEGVEKIEMEEMVRELRKMKNGKSLGVCNIQVELLKADEMDAKGVQYGDEAW